MTICFLCEVERSLCNVISLLCNEQGNSTVNDGCNESQNSYNRIANANAKFGEGIPPSRLNRWRMRWFLRLSTTTVCIRTAGASLRMQIRLLIRSLAMIPSRRGDIHFYRKSPSAIRSRSLKLCNANSRHKGGKENVFWRDFGLISAIGLPRLTRLNVGKRHVSHSNFYQLWQPLNG
jgi:hypothetical protein